jgi:hypothetical protein
VIRSKRYLNGSIYPIRDRLRERRLNAARGKMGKPRRICMRDVETGRLLTGHASQHRTKGARRWRTLLRIKRLIGASVALP